MQPIINAQAPEFKVEAYHNGEFKTVSSADLAGKWNIFFFYPADFTFVCPTELVDLAEQYSKLQEMGVEVYTSPTRLGTTLLIASRRLSILCSLTTLA